MSRRCRWTGCLVAALLRCGLPSCTGVEPSSDPDRARLGTAEAIETLYLEPGTPGLREWKRKRLDDAATMAKTVDACAAYYASARASTLRIAEAEPAIRASFRKLKELFPEGVFPDVYFVIGRLDSGGTSSEAGLLIGAEMYGRTDDPVVGRMGDWLASVLRPVDDVPGVVAHELVHYEQPHNGGTLLERALNEGSADFIGDLISGLNINAHVHAWVFAEPGRERALWEEFERQKDSHEEAGWFTTDDQQKRPKDLGYFMGYRIAQAYYEKSADKRAAIRDILLMEDPAEFLARSGYADVWR